MPKRHYIIRSLSKRPKELTILPASVFTCGLMIHISPVTSVAAGLGTSGAIASVIALRSWRRHRRVA